MSEVCTERSSSAGLPIWSRYNISPTYQSSDMFTPLQLPFRDTVPRSNTLSEGTTSCFPCMKYKTCPRDDLAGEGDEIYSLRNKTLDPSRLVPTGHRPIISTACTKAIHPSYQARKIGSILFSKLRINDEFILQPNLCYNHQLIMEENHFVREPSYSSHRSRNEMFPHSRGEYEIPPLPRELRQKQPLSDATQKALAGVVHRRYHMSSYEFDYKNPNPDVVYPPKQKSEEEEQKQFPDENPNGHQIQGLWPCWPPGRGSVVSDLTGQIVEKRDVSSLDDLHDYRNHKMSPPKKPREDRPSHFGNKISASDLIPLDNVNICGCDPNVIGGKGNVETESPFSIYLEKERNRIKPPNRTFFRRPAWTPEEPPRCKEDTKSTAENDALQQFQFKHQDNFKKLEKYHGKSEYDISINQRWVHKNRRDRQSERVEKHASGVSTSFKENQIVPVCSSREGDDLKIDDVKEEELAELKCPEDFNESEADLPEMDGPILNVKTPYYSSTRHHAFQREPDPSSIPDPFSLSLDLDRQNECLSLHLNSATHPLGAQKRLMDDMKSKRVQLGLKLGDAAKSGPSMSHPPSPWSTDDIFAAVHKPKKREEYSFVSDPSNPFSKSPIKLPPYKLSAALHYNGDRVPHRLGVQFRTIASKRYHAMHPESVPDLRENHPYLRKSVFLGYHASAFR